MNQNIAETIVFIGMFAAQLSVGALLFVIILAIIKKIYNGKIND